LTSIAELVQALGVAYAAGISPYATVAILGIGERLGWIGPLPGALDGIGEFWVIALASVLYFTEFFSTLIPGVASLWETAQSVIRPPAAALLALATVWEADPPILLAAALIGGGLGVATHGTKLGLRYAIDTSPEPVTNGAANVAELGLLASLLVFLWQHPFLSLGIALALLVLLALLVRILWRAARRTVSGLRAGERRAGDAAGTRG
jgi:Domain of unknown function (DUF4126)